MVAASTVGVSLPAAAAALCEFIGVKRRMELIYQDSAISVYDDFAHHPTAIKTTLEGLRAKVGDETIVAIIEPRSATMKMGLHQAALSSSVAAADQAIWYKSAAINWDLQAVATHSAVPALVCSDIESLLQTVRQSAAGAAKLHVVIMSNGGFEGFHQRLVAQLKGAG